MNTTNYKRSDGLDLGQVLLEREYFLSNYTNIANQFITPELWVWGRNYRPTLALNDTDGISRKTPVTTFAGGANWKEVCLSWSCGAAIKTDGTLWMWGNGEYGNLGNNRFGVTNVVSTPVTTFAGGNNWKKVSCSDYHTAAIKTDGTLWVWGNPGNGELGHNTSTSTNTPITTFAGGNNWDQVSAPDSQTIAIKTDGTLWVWGANGNAQLGINVSGNRSTPVTTFSGGNDWKQLKYRSILKKDGSIWILPSTSGGPWSTPTTMISGNDWKSISGLNAAIKTDGTLWTWGNNTNGQVGNNTTIYASTPVTTFAGGNNWKQVQSMAQGLGLSAIKTDGTLWVWGYNTYGALATNDLINRSTPVTTFAGGNDWKKIGNHSLSLASMAAIKSYDD